jgi:HlyD family secretion protein
VQRGAQVASGAPLFALESDNEIAARRQAEQQLQAAEARLANLMTGKRAPEVEMVAEQLRQARAARELSAANVRRQEALFKSGFISKAALDDVRTQLQRDDAAVSQLQASVATAKLPGRPDEIRAAEADASAARQALAQADWRLSQRAVAAPTAAHVSDTYYVVGDWVPAGGVVAACCPHVKIRFFVPKRAGTDQAGANRQFQLRRLRRPMSATVRLHLRPRRIHAAGAVLEGESRQARLSGRSEAAGGRGREAQRGAAGRCGAAQVQLDPPS